MQEKYSAFDLGLTGIIFGKDTHIFVHETGFVAFLCDEARDPGHILDGVGLCLYPQYYPKLTNNYSYTDSRRIVRNEPGQQWKSVPAATTVTALRIR